MKKKSLTKDNEEFDKRFDAGEDIHNLVDMSKASVIHHGKKVRITLDIAESLVSQRDRRDTEENRRRSRSFDQSVAPRKDKTGKSDRQHEKWLI